MQGLISDLLDVARIKTGALPVSPEAVDVARLVERARSAFLSGGGRDAVELDLPPDLTAVMADGRRVAQVLGHEAALTGLGQGRVEQNP